MVRCASLMQVCVLTAAGIEAVQLGAPKKKIRGSPLPVGDVSALGPLPVGIQQARPGSTAGTPKPSFLTGKARDLQGSTRHASRSTREKDGTHGNVPAMRHPKPQKKHVQLGMIPEVVDDDSGHTGDDEQEEEISSAKKGSSLSPFPSPPSSSPEPAPEPVAGRASPSSSEELHSVFTHFLARLRPERPFVSSPPVGHEYSRVGTPPVAAGAAATEKDARHEIERETSLSGEAGSEQLTMLRSDEGNNDWIRHRVEAAQEAQANREREYCQGLASLVVEDIHEDAPAVARWFVKRVFAYITAPAPVLSSPSNRGSSSPPALTPHGILENAQNLLRFMLAPEFVLLGDMRGAAAAVPRISPGKSSLPPPMRVPLGAVSTASSVFSTRLDSAPLRVEGEQAWCGQNLLRLRACEATAAKSLNESAPLSTTTSCSQHSTPAALPPSDPYQGPFAQLLLRARVQFLVTREQMRIREARGEIRDVDVRLARWRREGEELTVEVSQRRSLDYLGNALEWFLEDTGCFSRRALDGRPREAAFPAPVPLTGKDSAAEAVLPPKKEQVVYSL